VHATQREQRSRYAHVYHTKRWQLLRRAVITTQPICADCGERLSTIGDHVHPLHMGGAPYDPANIQGLCATCHSAKTRREMEDRYAT
jgi:5-methylcytosine-specific restriction endonuclease McrA